MKTEHLYVLLTACEMHIDTGAEGWHKLIIRRKGGGCIMKKQWRLKLAGALVALLFTAACVETVLIGLGASAALGGYKWMEGTMEKDYPKPMQETYNAALAAAKTLNLKVTTAAYNPLDSRIEASQPDGTSVKVQLLARPNQITTVKVRFGMMGNIDYSAYFHRQIMRNLGMPESP